jgi:P27 family predicted phage terminase small subunit
MTAGRRPKPAQLKVLEGNFRKDRDSHGANEQRPIGLPECPKWLPRSAKKYWSEVGPQLEKAGLISLLDQAAFAAHCDSVGKFEEITKKLKRLEDMVDYTPQNYAVQSVYFQIRNKLWDQVMKSANEFGLTPAGASKVKAPPQGQLDLGGFERI